MTIARVIHCNILHGYAGMAVTTTIYNFCLFSTGRL